MIPKNVKNWVTDPNDGRAPSCSICGSASHTTPYHEVLGRAIN